MTRKYNTIYSKDKYVTNFLWLLGMVMLKGTYFYYYIHNCKQEEI